MLKKINIHKSSVKDNIPLKLPDLQIANRTIERIFSIKAWTIEQKFAKNISLFYSTKQLLNLKSIKIIHFSLHSFLFNLC